MPVYWTNEAERRREQNKRLIEEQKNRLNDYSAYLAEQKGGRTGIFRGGQQMPRYDEAQSRIGIDGERIHSQGFTTAKDLYGRLGWTGATTRRDQAPGAPQLTDNQALGLGTSGQQPVAPVVPGSSAGYEAQGGMRQAIIGGQALSRASGLNLSQSGARGRWLNQAIARDEAARQAAMAAANRAEELKLGWKAQIDVPLQGKAMEAASREKVATIQAGGLAARQTAADTAALARLKELRGSISSDLRAQGKLVNTDEWKTANAQRLLEARDKAEATGDTAFARQLTIETFKAYTDVVTNAQKNNKLYQTNIDGVLILDEQGRPQMNPSVLDAIAQISKLSGADANMSPAATPKITAPPAGSVSGDIDGDNKVSPEETEYNNLTRLLDANEQNMTPADVLRAKTKQRILQAKILGR